MPSRDRQNPQPSDQRGRNTRLTCFQAEVIEVVAAAEVVLTMTVAAASWGLGLLQLEAPPLTGAPCVPLWFSWDWGGAQLDTNDANIPVGIVSNIGTGRTPLFLSL